MITVKEALNRLDTKGFDSSSKDECYEAVQRANEGRQIDR